MSGIYIIFQQDATHLYNTQYIFVRDSWSLCFFEVIVADDTLQNIYSRRKRGSRYLDNKVHSRRYLAICVIGQPFLRQFVHGVPKFGPVILLLFFLCFYSYTDLVLSFLLLSRLLPSRGDKHVAAKVY